MRRGASPFDQDATARVTALLRSAAEFTPPEPLAPDLAERAMAHWRERHSRSRSRRRAAGALCAATGLLAVLGFLVRSREQERLNGHTDLQIVQRQSRDLRPVNRLSPTKQPVGARRQKARDRRSAALERPSPKPLKRGTPSGNRATLREPQILPTDSDELLRPDVPARSRDAADLIEARVRRATPVRDDFVQIPFPRLAATSERPIADAIQSYQREAAIVDTRLVREVALALKATALSDLCERLRGDTGIQLAAGPSVADEKVTVFCEKLPLRDVMRQLSRPFGYTWLRSGKAGEYRYELVQDLRSQLLEEELRNRDRDAALIALDQQMQLYRRYLALSPDEALARSKNAAADEKQLLEQLAGQAWGITQLYFRLAPRDLAALRAGQSVSFSPAPAPGQRALPPDVARGVFQSWRDFRILRSENGRFQMGTAEGLPEGVPLTAVPDTRPVVALTLTQNELGQYTLAGGVGFRIGGDPNRLLAEWQAGADSFGGGTTFSVAESGRGTFVTNLPLATATSGESDSPRNEVVNARLARDSTLRLPVTILPEPSCVDLSPDPSLGVNPSPSPSPKRLIMYHRGESSDGQSPPGDHGVQSAQTQPERLHARLALRGRASEPSQPGYRTHRFPCRPHRPPCRLLQHLPLLLLHDLLHGG